MATASPVTQRILALIVATGVLSQGCTGPDDTPPDSTSAADTLSSLVSFGQAMRVSPPVTNAALLNTAWVEVTNVQPRYDEAGARVRDSVSRDAFGLRSGNEGWTWHLAFHYDSAGQLRLRQTLVGEGEQRDERVLIDGSGTMMLQVAVTADEPPILWCRLGTPKRLVCVDTARHTMASLFKRVSAGTPP